MESRKLGFIAVALGDQALVSGANFLLLVAVSRCGDSADLARYALTYTVVVFVGCVHLALILQPLGMLLPERDGAKSASYLATLARLHHRCALVGAALALLAAWLHGPLSLVGWGAAACAARIAQEYERRAAYCLQDNRRALLIDLTTYVPLSLAAIALVMLRPEAGAITGLALLTLGNLLGAATGAVLNRGAVKAIPDPLKPILREHWEVGRWLVGGALLAALSDHLHPFLIAGILGLHETALLAAARSLTSIGNVAINGFDAYAGPRLRQLAISGGLPALRAATISTGALLIGSLLVVCVPLLAAPRWLMGVIYGDTYQAGWWLLAAFAVIFLVRGVNKLLGLVLLALKRPGSGFIAIAINAMATTVTAPFLVQAYGLKGAVVGLGANAVVITVVLGIGVARAWRQARAHGVDRVAGRKDPGIADV